MPSVLLRLPEDMRGDLKEPLGPIRTDAGAILSETDGPIVAIGDVVSYHVETAGQAPDVAVIDGRTKRSAVDQEVETVLDEAGRDRITAENPAGTITASLLDALVEALAREEPVQVAVDGEEDLAALPAVLAAPDGATILYGQPDEGMVTVTVDEGARERVRRLLAAMEGDVESVFSRLNA